MIIKDDNKRCFIQMEAANESGNGEMCRSIGGIRKTVPKRNVILCSLCRTNYTNYQRLWYETHRCSRNLSIVVNVCSNKLKFWVRKVIVSIVLSSSQRDHRQNDNCTLKSLRKYSCNFFESIANFTAIVSLRQR